MNNFVQDSPDDDSDDDEVESILLDQAHKWWNLWALAESSNHTDLR